MKQKAGFFGVMIAFLLIMSITVIGCQTGTIEKGDFLVEQDISHVTVAPAMEVAPAMGLAMVINKVQDVEFEYITNTSKAEWNESYTVLTTSTMEGGSIDDGTIDKPLATVENFKELGNTHNKYDFTKSFDYPLQYPLQYPLARKL